MFLTNIGMINWHTYGAIDIKLDGDIIGVIGDNGSGKSTLLDALYVVVTGGSQNNMNKRAQGRSSAGSPTVKRSIHSYCLGRLNEKTTIRKEANTYLLAGFEDPNGKKEPVTLLMAFHATGDNIKAHMEARAVIKGALIKTTDIIEKDENGNSVILPWGDLRPILDKKVTDAGGSLKTFSDSMTKYVQDYLQAMMYRGHYEAHQQYVSNLENAIALKEVKSATEFVQDYVLREGPIDIHALRSTAVTFNKLVEHLRIVKSQISDLEDLIVDLDKKKAAERSEAIEKAVKLMSEAVMSRRKNRLQRFTISSKSVEKTAIMSELASINRECAVIQSEIKALEKRKYEMGETSFIDTTTTKIASLRQTIDLTLSRLLGERGIGRLAHHIRYKLQSIAPENGMLPAFVALNETVNGTGKASVDYLPENANAADSAFYSAISAIGEFLPAIKDQHADLRGASVRIEAECKELQTQISNIESQKSIRDEWLNNFVNMLHKNGIEADILYEVAEIADEDWRDAIERLLGGSRDTVFVPANGFDLAARLLDENQREFQKVRLATTAKLLRHSTSHRTGTLTSVLTSENKLAAAYLDMKYGSVQLASCRDDFKKDGRWLTKSGLFEDGASVTVLRPERPKIGKNGLQQSLPLLKHDLEEKAAELVGIRQAYFEYDKLITDLSNFSTLAGHFDDQEKVFSTSKHEVISGNAKIREYQDLIIAKKEECDTSVLDEEIESYKEELAGLNNRHNDLKLKEYGYGRDIEDAQKHLGGSINLLGSNAHMSAMNEAFRVNALNIHSDLLNAAFVTLKNRWKAKGGLKGAENALTIIKNRAESEHRKAQDYLNKTSYDTKTKIGHVLDCLSGRSELPEEYTVDDHLYPWATKTLADLKNHKLIDYEEQFEVTKKRADELFKTGFINELASKFDEVERQISSLNAVIRNTEFLGEKYKIKLHHAPGREVFHRVVKNENEISTAVTGGGLFMGTLSPEIQEDMDEIKRLLFTSDETFDLDEYTDYRKYYTFDLEMTNELTGAKTSLAERKATGSGGEIQTPYYICILAAMSNVYYGGPFKNLKKDDGGLCLAIFDEAFSNMDEKVTGQVIDLGRQLGLQMIICGPSNKKITMQRNCETVLTVVKSADARSTRIYGEQIKAKARNELKALDPALKSDAEIAVLMEESERA